MLRYRGNTMCRPVTLVTVTLACGLLLACSSDSKPATTEFTVAASQAAASAAPTATATAAPVTATPIALTGTTTTEKIDVDGVAREAIIYVPASRRAAEPLSVIVLLHGLGSGADRIWPLLRLSEEAERRGFLAVYPNGSPVLGTCCGWNDGNLV
jgi:poly(3-hydroxybutyrate) depolymerase